MLTRRIFRLLSVALLVALPKVLLAGGGPHHTQSYQVTITNLTGGIVLNDAAPAGQIMSPPVVATHNNHLEPLFLLGQPASSDLWNIAEDAINGPLATTWGNSPSVMDVEQGSAPIMPGQSATIVVKASKGFNRISLVGMLVTTNDGFYALNGMRLPDFGSVTYYSPGYDAGTEKDSELCSKIPGPPCGSHNVRDTAGAPGYVFIHSGIHGIGDLQPAQFDWKNPVAKITITAM
jgi:hypothetical protein